MTRSPIHVILSQLKPLALHQQIYRLQALVQQMSPRSLIRHELESVLKAKMQKQLKKENKEKAA